MLNTGKKYCRMLLSTFIKLPFVIKILVLSIFEWPLKTGFTVWLFNNGAIADMQKNTHVTPFLKVNYIQCSSFLTLCLGSKEMDHVIYRGSYMRAHVLLNLLNEMGKSDKMRGLPSILLLFRNKFKFNNTGARMLDFLYHKTLNLLKNHIFGMKKSRFCTLLCNIIMEVITLRY